MQLLLLKTALISLLTINVLVEGKESFILSHNATESKCFPVRLNDTPGYLNINLKSYISEVNGGYPDIAVLVARRDDIKYKKKYYNDKGGSYKICTVEAIKDGYCTHRKLGKYLYELNDPFGFVGANRLIYDDILWELGTQEGVFNFQDSGYYCIFTHSEDAHSYQIDVEVIDGHVLNNEQRVRLLFADIELVLNGLFLLSFSTAWNFWKTTKINEIPYVVRFIMISTSFEFFLNSLVKFDLQYLAGAFPVVSLMIDLFSQIHSLVILLCIYQFSLDFSYSFSKNLLKDKEGLFYFVVTLLSTVLNSLFPSMLIFSKTKNFLKAFIIVITLVNYRLLAEDYTYHLSLSSIKHSQFRSLILSTIFTQFILPTILLNPVSIQAFNIYAFPKISPLINKFFPSFANPLIDSSLEKLFGDVELPLVVSLVSLFIRYYGAWTHWNPITFKNGLLLEQTLTKLKFEKNQ